MTVLDTINDLKKIYTTSDPLYLSNFFQPNGEKWLYDSLSKLYQAKYENNYRILVVQDCNDVYDYSDLPGQAITALQKFGSQIDISNFFILLLTNNPAAHEELTQAQMLYSTDQNPIQYHVVESLPVSEKTIKVSNTFCVYPWMHLYIGTDGNILPCCNGLQQHPMGSVRTHSIDDILKSATFNQLRKNMLSGLRSKECKRCYDFEDAGQPSPRVSANKQWEHLKNLNFNKDGTIDQFNPAYIDVRLSNVCNLKCRMCSGYYSSAIAAEEAELFGNRSYINDSLHNQDRKTELKEILDYVPYAEEIYFAGGEPLLSAEHYEILNRLIECNNTNVKIFYNTNFTNLYFKGQAVTELWNKFSNIIIGASLDATGEVAEYVRYGSDWKVIEQNLIFLKEKSPHVKFTVTSTVGFMNVASLIKLQKQWHNDNILNISKFSLTTTISPRHLTVRVLPEHHKARLSGMINHHIDWCKQNQAHTLASQWKDIMDYMLSADHVHYLDEFVQITTTVDSHRKQSFVKVFPEFQDLLSYEFK
jgi:radical SAM protein with 4Fe4S-binding SPASM domain